MADEALLRIKIEPDAPSTASAGAAGTAPAGGAPPAPASPPGGQPAQPPRPAGAGAASETGGRPARGAFDALLDAAALFRGTLAGVFGTFVGAALDAVAAFRDLRRQSVRPPTPEPAPPTPVTPPAPPTPMPAAPAPSITTPAAPTAPPVAVSTPPIAAAPPAPVAPPAPSIEPGILTIERALVENMLVARLAILNAPMGGGPAGGAPAPGLPAPLALPPPASPQLLPAPPSPAARVPALPPPPMPPAAPSAATAAAPAAGEAAGAAGAAAAGGGALASAAAVIPVVGAVLAAAMALISVFDAIKDSAVGAVRGLGDFAAGLGANDSNNPARVLEGIGSATKSATDHIFLFTAALGPAGTAIAMIGPVAGEAVEQLGRFLRALDNVATRYAEFSPELARAEAMAEVTQVVGDLRRSQMIGPELARYVQMRTQLQDQLEDVKVRILKMLLPAVNSLMTMGQAGLDIASKLLQGFGTLLQTIPGFEELGRQIRDLLEPDRSVQVTLPTRVILEGPIPQSN